MAEQRKNYSNGQYSGRNTSQNVVEIDLVSLFNFSMKRWRILLVLMIVLAILFAGVKALKTYSELNTLKTIENGGDGNREAIEENLPEEYIVYENIKDSYDVQNATAARTLKNTMEYMDESILYNIDSNEVHRADVTYMITAEGETQGVKMATESKIIKDYVAHFEASDVYSSIDPDIDEKYIRELISISSDSENGMLKVSIVGPDDEFVLDIASKVKDEISNEMTAIIADVAPHSISLVSEKEYVTSDNVDFDVTENANVAKASLNSDSEINVAKAQYEVNLKVSSLQTMINNSSTYSKSITEPSVVTEESVKSGFTSGVIKYAIIGALIGLIIFFCIYAFYYAVSQTILDTKKFTSAFRNVTLLGDYYAPIKNNATALDKALALHDGRRGGLDDLENVMKLSSANLSNVLISSGDTDKLLVTGTADEETLKRFKTAFTAYIDTLSEKPVKDISLTKNIIADFEGAKALSEADSIVLIESKEKSRISDIREEILEIEKIGKNLAGVVLV